MISRIACTSLAANQPRVLIGDTRSWRIQPFCRSRASCGPLANMAEPMPDHTAIETSSSDATVRPCEIPCCLP